MRTTKKTTYPSYPVEIQPSDEDDDNSSGVFKPHDFDKPSTRKLVKKWRKDNISYGDGPLRGLQPLRSLYYKANEAKIPATTRMGYI